MYHYSNTSLSISTWSNTRGSVEITRSYAADVLSHIQSFLTDYTRRYETTFEKTMVEIVRISMLHSLLEFLDFHQNIMFFNRANVNLARNASYVYAPNSSWLPVAFQEGVINFIDPLDIVLQI